MIMDPVSSAKHSATIMTKCRLCGCMTALEVQHEDVEAWIGGMLCQDAFPYLTPIERDVLILKLCPDCQEKICP